MKFATIVLLAIALLGSFASLQADDRIGAGEVVYAFTSVLDPDNKGWCDDKAKTCICFIYLPLVSGIEEKALFKDGVVGEANAHLTWVSEFPAEQTMWSNPPFTLAMVPAGPAAIYYDATPGKKRNPRDPKTLGEIVARFNRKAGLFVSTGSGVDPFVSSADLVWSTPFVLNGKWFNFRDLIPRGITCHEVVSSTGTEAGSCVATGN